MKNVFALLAFSILLLCVSCSKESISLPEPDSIQALQEQNAASSVKDDVPPLAEMTTNEPPVLASVTIQLPVVEMNSSEVAGELLVEFSGSYDFRGVVLEDTQYLVFEDANNQESTLTFQVNSYSGGNGTLDATFSIGGNDLTGLDLTGLQSIIIEEGTIQ